MKTRREPTARGASLPGFGGIGAGRPRRSCALLVSLNFLGTPETSACVAVETRRATCISACVYLLPRGERLGLNAVQWLSLSKMTKTFCGCFI